MPSTALAVHEPTSSTVVLPPARPGGGGVTKLGVEGWLGAMSEQTAKAYAADLAQFTSWLTGTGRGWDDVTPGVVNAWLADLTAGRSWGTEPQFRAWATAHSIDPDELSRAERKAARADWLADVAAGTADGTPLTKASQARKVSAVRSFYRYARGEGVTSIDPAPGKTPKPERDEASGSIDLHQANAVWTATKGKPRRRALVAVMLFCGLRVAEAVGLQVADIQEQQGERVLRVMGKGSKPRTAVLPAVAVEAITQWLEVRGRQPGPLFSTRGPGRGRPGAAMSTRAAHQEIRNLGEKVGIAGLHPHMLRHTFATSAVDSGVDVLRLATALGHASPTTTMRYVRGRDVITNSPVHQVAGAILGGGGARRAPGEGRRERQHSPIVTDNLW